MDEQVKRPIHTTESERKLRNTPREEKMTTTKRIPSVLTIALVAMGIMGLTVGQVGAASITIANPGFEFGNNGQTPPPHNTQIVDDWDQTAQVYIANNNTYKPAVDAGPSLCLNAHPDRGRRRRGSRSYGGEHVRDHIACSDLLGLRGLGVASSGLRRT
jgi:hypothetical protein